MEVVGLNRNVLNGDFADGVDRVPASLYEEASFNDDGVFSNLAAHVGTPSWTWGELTTGKGVKESE